MKFIFIILLFILKMSANDLKYETSPYLKQHSTNPINWYAYNDKTLALAREENKIIFLSIGYSTCHWCHVMAEESFTNKKLAKLFNKYFISIKVDKEEMPHLDSYYQELHKINKNHPAGWPINIFMTPQKDVFYMSGYIPPNSKDDYEGFDKLLTRLAMEYKNKDYKVFKTNSDALHVEKKWDEFGVGFGDGAKFPEVARLHKLLDKNDKRAYEMLDVMAKRGLYDHVDGGFFRYTVDSDWEIPHFEKMLYNQAELIQLYTRAYLLTKKELYKKVVLETINMSNKVFLKDGVYFSASDAVSNKEEGAYFTFTKKELLEVFGDTKYAVPFHLKYHIVSNTNKKNELIKIRLKREYPFIDKKINTAWNALMIEALFKASKIDRKYSKEADKHLKILTNLMFDKGELYHQTLLHVEPKQKGFLEDYSFMISALIAGYEVTNDEEKLNFAKYLYIVAKRKFYRNTTWYLSDDNLNIEANLNNTHYTSPLTKMLENIKKLDNLL